MQEYLKNLFDFNKTIASSYILKYDYPEVLNHIGEIIFEISKTLNNDYQEISPNVFVHKSVKIDKSATIMGPCLVLENSEIRVNAYIRGNVIIGKNCVIGNSTELKNAILFDEVKVPHFNYIGDSLLGYKVHFGAGSLTSNVKSDESNVTLTINSEKIKTNRKKIGALVGDKVEIGCNTVLTPGSIIGKNTTIYPLVMVRGEIPENKIVKSTTMVDKR